MPVLMLLHVILALAQDRQLTGTSIALSKSIHTQHTSRAYQSRAEGRATPPAPTHCTNSEMTTSLNHPYPLDSPSTCQSRQQHCNPHPLDTPRTCQSQRTASPVPARHIAHLSKLRVGLTSNTKTPRTLHSHSAHVLCCLIPLLTMNWRFTAFLT